MRRLAAALAIGPLLIVAWLLPSQAQAAAEGQYTSSERSARPTRRASPNREGSPSIRASGEVYAIDGRSEVQTITVSATAGKFKLRFGAEAAELAIQRERGQVEAALRNIVCAGAASASASKGARQRRRLQPLQSRLQRTAGDHRRGTDRMRRRHPAALGRQRLHGGNDDNGVNGTISRWHADGTPADFSALGGSNAIDGRGPGLTRRRRKACTSPCARMRRWRWTNRAGPPTARST